MSSGPLAVAVITATGYLDSTGVMFGCVADAPRCPPRPRPDGVRGDVLHRRRSRPDPPRLLNRTQHSPGEPCGKFSFIPNKVGGSYAAVMGSSEGYEVHTHGGSAHAHRHAHGVSTSRLIGAASLNSGFAVIQVIVGLSLGSVVVLADAAHQIVDAVGLITALLATLLARRPTSSTMSFGWGKTDALGAFVSGLLLMASVAWIIYESISRLFDPVDVDGGGVIAIGLVAIAVNGLSVIALSSSGHSSLSLRAARLHLLTDLAGSFLVVAAGIVLAGTSWTWIDPVASLILSAVVLRVTADLVTSAAHELLDRVPAGISVAAVTEMLDQQPGVERVHHVHVRPLGQERASVTAHVVVAGQPSLHEAQDQLDTLTSALHDHLGITHATLQLECHPCANDGC